MSLNNPLNHLVPAIFDSPAWEDKIVLLQFVRIKGNSISVIEMNQEVLRTIESTNPANLHPFKNWKVTGTGNIQFDTIGATAHRYFNELRRPVNRNINQQAMATIHGFRDIRSAQANDRDDEPNGEY